MTLRFPFGRWITIAASLAIGQAAMAAESRPRIEDIETQREANRLEVSFRLVDALPDERLESIHSGNPVTFRHVVELVNRRSPRLWPARVLARTRIETSVRYDSLIGQYELTRRTERPIPKDFNGEKVLEETLSTDALDEVRGWLTELEHVPVMGSGSDSIGRRTRLRVRTLLGRHYWLYFVPTRQTVSAEQRVEP